MPLIGVATITPIPEHRDAVLAALLESIPAVHEEPGCDLYSLHESKTAFVIIEQWADGEALQAHGAGENFRALTAALDGLLAEPLDVKILKPVPAGTSGQGQLV